MTPDELDQVTRQFVLLSEQLAALEAQLKAHVNETEKPIHLNRLEVVKQKGRTHYDYARIAKRLQRRYRVRNFLDLVGLHTKPVIDWLSVVEALMATHKWNKEDVAAIKRAASKTYDPTWKIKIHS
jgi:hypothetical protein